MVCAVLAGVLLFLSHLIPGICIFVTIVFQLCLLRQHILTLCL